MIHHTRKIPQKQCMLLTRKMKMIGPIRLDIGRTLPLSNFPLVTFFNSFHKQLKGKSRNSSSLLQLENSQQLSFFTFQTSYKRSTSIVQIASHLTSRIRNCRPICNSIETVSLALAKNSLSKWAKNARWYSTFH